MDLSDSVHVVPEEEGHLTVFSGCSTKVCPRSLVFLNDIPCSVKKVDNYSLTVFPHSDFEVTSDACQLTQTCVQHDPQEIFGTLNAYWQQFWQKPLADPLVQSDDFLQSLLDTITPMHFSAIDCTDPEQWVQAICDIKPAAARGVDHPNFDNFRLLLSRIWPLL